VPFAAKKKRYCAGSSRAEDSRGISVWRKSGINAAQKPRLLMGSQPRPGPFFIGKIPAGRGAKFCGARPGAKAQQSRLARVTRYGLSGFPGVMNLDVREKIVK
jgi:hypothetical protein